MSERLTIKNKELDYYYFDDDENDGYFTEKEYEVAGKLGQYEDIDEEIGINYITLNKLRKTNKIYYLNNNNEIMETVEIFSIDFINCNLKTIITSPFVDVWDFKDYGKTWALTREELENE